MRVFFDESGQSGCVLPNKKGDLFNKNHRFFVLAGVVCSDEGEENLLREKYAAFLKHFNITADELKGSDILTRENNDKLLYFIDNLLDDKHFYICCYDKIFYLATLMNVYFFGWDMMCSDPLIYFTQASALAREDEIIFKKFCKAVKENTAKARKDFVKFLANYHFKRIDPRCNLYILAANKMLNIFNDYDFPEFPLPLGCYQDEKITNLINLNALGESLLALKVMHPSQANNISIVHDHIREFENEFVDTLKSSDPDVTLSFADSKDELLVQYADNVASIFRKAFFETTDIFSSCSQWKEDRQWFPSILAKLLQKITVPNIKFVTAISDWTLALCVEKLFAENAPAGCKTDRSFQSLFKIMRNRVLETIENANYNVINT